MLKFLFPEKDGGATFLVGDPGRFFSIFVEKPDDFYPLFDCFLLGMSGDIFKDLHEVNISPDSPHCHIYLLHPDPFGFSPPESNMFLNFCRLFTIKNHYLYPDYMINQLSQHIVPYNIYFS